MDKISITTHAKERFVERFPHSDIRQELSQAVRFGAQLGTEYSCLSPCGAVFIIKKDVIGQLVKTVLTQQQALVNMQTFVKSSKDLNFSYLQEQPPKHELELANQQLTEMAKVHAIQDHKRGNKESTTRRERNKQLREQGFDLTGPHGQFYRSQYMEHRVLLNKEAKTKNVLTVSRLKG